MEEKYLQAAKAAYEFINTRKRNGEKGIYWSMEDGAKGRDIYYDEISLYAGASGIICFLLGLYRETAEQHFYEEAAQAGEYIVWRWNHDRELKRNFSKYAFSSGWSGAGFALSQLYLAGKDKVFADTVSEIVTEIIGAENCEGDGYRWSSYPGIVGEAGTVLFLLYAADVFSREDWKKSAIDAGRMFLGKGRWVDKTKRVYLGVDPTYFHAKPDYIDPNFPMGTAGIGYTLLRLYEESGEPEFLEAVKGIPEYMDYAAVKIKRGRLLPHGLPDRANLFYVGYCHGPVGTNRFYYKLAQVTGEEKYLAAIQELNEGLKDIGAPGKRSEGYWNCYNLCCGTAGLVQMQIGLWAAFGKQENLDAAIEAGEELLAGAQWSGEKEGSLQASWDFALDRIAPGRTCTPIGFLDGAAGIGAVLLQLHQASQGKLESVRFVDDPFPAQVDG